MAPKGHGEPCWLVPLARPADPAVRIALLARPADPAEPEGASSSMPGAARLGVQLEKTNERGTHNPLGSAYLPLQML